MSELLLAIYRNVFIKFFTFLLLERYLFQETDPEIVNENDYLIPLHEPRKNDTCIDINDNNTEVRIINRSGQTQFLDVTLLDDTNWNFTQTIPGELNDIDGDGESEVLEITISLSSRKF